MEQENATRSQRLRDEDFDVRGARNISKLEKLESEQTQTTTSRSVTTNGATQYTNRDDSMPQSQSSEILIDDVFEQRTTPAIADETDDWRSRKTVQRSDVVEQRSDTQAQRYGAEERRSGAAEYRSDAKEQKYSAAPLSRRERNVAAAVMAYRMAHLPDDIELGQVTKRSKVVSTDSQTKSRGGLRGLGDTADMIVDDTMEQAIEALYGKKRRRKMVRDVKTSSSGETRSLDRRARTTAAVDERAHAGYDTMLSENRALGRTVNETMSRDESRKKAVSYLRAEKDDEDVEEDVDLRRPASADGRLTNRVDYTVRKRAQGAHRLQHTAPSRPRHQATYMSPTTSHYQRRINLMTAQQVGGYSSETELRQSSRRADQRRHFSGDDSDFSTTVEIRNPRPAQLRIENGGGGGYTSDDSESWNLPNSSHSRAPTLTKGMVTKILHGNRPQPQTTETLYTEVRRPEVQSATSPVQFTASPPSSFKVMSYPTVHRDGQLSAVIPVWTETGSRSSYRPSAVDENFLLRQAPAYQSRFDGAQYFARACGTGRSTPASIQAMVETDDWQPSSYTAFSNEPIIVTNLDDDYATNAMSMRRTQSLFALDAASPVGIGTGRSQTPAYSSRPDIRMTNRQVLNLYLFNKVASGDTGRTPELETMTSTMIFDDEAHRTAMRNQQTQTTISPAAARRENVPLKQAKRRKPTPSRVTEETVIVKPSITETIETEMVGDVFADRRRVSPQEPAPPTVSATRSSHAGVELHQEEPEEEEILETTVVEEKEQRIEMTIREDLEFSLQRSRGTAGKAVTGSTDEGRVEPWWIPDTFEAFVERKRQKTTQTKDTENKDDHSKRIDIENSARITQEGTYHDASESQNFQNSSYNETDSHNQSTRRNRRADAGGNIRIPIFLEGRYQSPLHGMTSPSSNLVRSKMTTHSEPDMDRRNQYYMAKRDKYYGSLFDDSRRKPLITDSRNNESSLPVASSRTKKRQQTSSGDVPEFRLEVAVDDEASDKSNAVAEEPRSSQRRYVSSYSHYISPPISSGDNVPPVADDDYLTRSRGHSSHQPMTDTVFPTSKIISLPRVELKGGGTHGTDDDQLPASLDHFDRVLTEIEDELPPPPLPPPLPPASNQARNTSSQPSLIAPRSYYVIKSSSKLSADTPPMHKTSKPPPPEKSWKRGGHLPAKSGRLYSSQERPADSTASSAEKQRSTASKSESQSTGSKATDKEISAASSSSGSAGRLQQQAGSDFRRELGDGSYISLSLTEPVQREERRRIEVVTKGQKAEPDGFTYGWASQEQKKRKQSSQPGSYQLRHSRSPAEDYDMAATAL